MRDRGTVKVVGPAMVGAGLILAATPTAFAADGTGGFSYRTGRSPNAGVIMSIDNPTPVRCYATQGVASGGVNRTDLVAHIFKDGDCGQLAAIIAPGQSVTMVSFASVKFTDQRPVSAPGTPTKP